MPNADPITMQVIRYGLEQIADEMGYTMVRTSRSTIIKEIMDITCAVFDHNGKTLAQAHHAPMLLTGFEITMERLLQEFPEDQLHDGDIIIANDPYQGGQHIMDIQTFAPVRFEDRVVGFTGSIAHHSDMGGAAAGEIEQCEDGGHRLCRTQGSPCSYDAMVQCETGQAGGTGLAGICGCRY